MISLVGENPNLDHHHVHIVEPNNRVSQHNHQDSTFDNREKSFDIQLLYFPQSVETDMGGTRFIPGSHLRQVHESQIARYQNFLGQKRVCCLPGTIYILHHGLWHGAGLNSSQKTRYMYKVRFQPRIKQSLLWDTSDINSTTIKKWERPIFHGDISKKSIPNILMKYQPWYDNEGRLEMINRIKLWRLLLNSPNVDIDYWLTRLKEL